MTGGRTPEEALTPPEDFRSQSSLLVQTPVPGSHIERGRSGRTVTMCSALPSVSVTCNFKVVTIFANPLCQPANMARV